LLLALLIVTSLILTVNIWFEKELWPSGYSSFLYSFQKIFNSKKADNERIFRFSPNYITLTLNSRKMIAYLGNDEFPELKDIVSKIAGGLSKNGTVSEISAEDFLNAHKTNSLLVHFPTEISLKSFLGKDDSFFIPREDPKSVSLIISIDSFWKYIYFSDGGKNYRMSVSYDEKPYMVQLNRFTPDVIMSRNFAFELNLDKRREDADFIVFDSFVPIESAARKIKKLDITPVLYGKNSPYDGIFKAFYITKNSARSYTDNENVINFIENQATLKIYGDGSFSYEKNRGFDGIKLPAGDERLETVKFVNSLYADCLPDSGAFLRLTSIGDGADGTVYELNYITENGAVYFSRPSGVLSSTETEPEQPLETERTVGIEQPLAVTVSVKDGYIVSYKQKLCQISESGAFIEVSDIIKAYD
jgi:hypothetical protein